MTGCPVQAEFELEALLLTGSCVDIAARSREQVGANTPSSMLILGLTLKNAPFTLNTKSGK